MVKREGRGENVIEESKEEGEGKRGEHKGKRREGRGRRTTEEGHGMGGRTAGETGS